MKSVRFIFPLLLLIGSSSQAQFSLKGKLVTNRNNQTETDFKDRNLSLLRGADTIIGHIRTRHGEFSVPQLEAGRYVLSYSNRFNQTIRKEVLLTKNLENIDLRTDTFIDTNTPSLIGKMAPADRILLSMASQGCFHSSKSSIEIKKRSGKLIADYTAPDNTKITKTLTKHDTETLSLFEKQLRQMKTVPGGCTTIDYYNVAVNGEPVLSVNDGSCDWNGWHYLIRDLFGVKM